MDAEQLARVQAAFDAAVGLSPDLRPEALTKACGGDAELRTFVEALLAEHDRGLGDFLATRVEPSTEPGLEEAGHPAPGWTRYEIQGFLGAGGMGRVWRAFDPRLERTVALKFLHGTDPRAVERFRREAQAQARVEHEHLCQIYEVGEAQGSPYISMQFIDGLPLSQVATRLSVEQKVKLVKEVAEALHAAHRVGLIHRDVKPANIMVEETDGGWRPWLMDFGLAREASSPGMTVTGAILGTPHYMSPEQARGEVRGLDRRSDVYGLGATLYEILSGRRVFPGEGAAELIPQILGDVPRRLRDGRLDVPADVESITLKCLRKAPGERYESARALAEDLGRYLDGEPVHARPTTILYRWRMRITRHPVATVTAVVAVVLLAGSLAWGLYGQWTANQRSRLAQEFGQQVERMDGIARLAAMAALHDVRPERNRIRERMAEIETQMKRIGDLALGPGQYALGRGSLALERYPEAMEHLRAAWAAGYQEPEVAYSLGLVLGELYRRRLRDAAQISSPKDREEARRSGEREYGDPARRYLERSAGVEIESPAYVAALLAHYENRHEDALALAREAYEGHPWFYEAKELEGDVYVARGDERSEHGEYDAARGEYGRAREAYEAALAVGASDLGVRERLGLLALRRMVLEIDGRGEDVEHLHREGMEIVRAALIADPDSPSLHVLAANLHMRMGEQQGNRGEDPRPMYIAALASARRGLSGGREDAHAHRVIGSTYRLLANEERNRGVDPRESFEAAIEAYDAAIRLAPDNLDYSRMGLLHKSYALHQMGVGEDPSSSLAKSAASYREAIARNPDRMNPHHNLGVTNYTLARHRMGRGEDPREALSAAIASYERALAINPNSLATFYNLGRAHRVLGEYQSATGEDPVASLRHALEALTSAIDVNPESVYLAHLRDGMGKTYVRLAIDEIARGDDPTESLERGVEQFGLSLAANPRFQHAHANLAYLFVVRGRHELALGADPSASIARAIDAAESALAINPKQTASLVARGEALEAHAVYELENGRDPSPSLARAEAALVSALDVNDELTEAHRARGRVAIVRGRWLASTGGDPGPAFEEAVRGLRLAHDLDPADARACEELAQVCRRRAEWSRSRQGPARSEIIRGIEFADQALSRNPRFEEARALRGLLLLYAADSEETPARRTERWREAEMSLDRALSANRHLSREFLPYRREIASCLHSEE